MELRGQRQGVTMTAHNAHLITALKHIGAHVGKSDRSAMEKEEKWIEIDDCINRETMLATLTSIKWLGSLGAEFIPKLKFEAWQKGRVLIPTKNPDIPKCWKQAGIVNRWMMENLR